MIKYFEFLEQGVVESASAAAPVIVAIAPDERADSESVSYG